MALILEVLDGRSGEVGVRLRLDALPLSVGRGYGNDLILDDPYVDARHAIIAADEAGGLAVQDLGSLNGLVVTGAAQRATRVAVRPGLELRVGRTMLRFRDPEETVPPALPDATRGSPAASRWLSTWRGWLAVSLAALGAFAAYAWLRSYEASGASAAVGGALGIVVLLAAWAGPWAIASRIVVDRFRFFAHFGFAAALAVASLAWTVAGEWVSFLFPDTPVWSPAAVVFGLAALGVLVAGHLALATNLWPRQRWLAGLVTACVLLAVVGVVTLAEEESFSDVPEFSGVLKPLAPEWVPAGTVEEFRRTAADLKEEVDAIAGAE